MNNLNNNKVGDKAFPTYNIQSLNPIEQRLLNEFRAVHDVCMQNDFIDYEILDLDYKKRPPRKYLIHYKLISIIGIDHHNNPILGDHHTVSLEVPKHYPVESLIPYTKSKVWHPNIKWDGEYEGRICGNVKDFGKNYSLELLILRIKQILTYKNYLAENVPPYPEDERVAKWVREYAEPQGFIQPGIGIVTEKIPAEQVMEIPGDGPDKNESNQEVIPEPVEEKRISITLKSSMKKMHNERPQPPAKKSGNSMINIKPK